MLSLDMQNTALRAPQQGWSRAVRSALYTLACRDGCEPLRQDTGAPIL